MRLLWGLLCLLVSVMQVPHAAQSADATNLMGRDPAAQDFIEALTPRGIGIHVEEDPAEHAPRRAEPASVTRPAADVTLKFRFDSAELTPEARGVLDELAMAIESEQLTDYAFILEGHTDAVGSDAYNEDLSRRRAAAARDYLVEQHQVDPERLSAVGKGESELLDAQNPAAAINRRVRIINAGAT